MRKSGSPERLTGAALPARFTGERTLSTAIVYLLRSGEFSCFHRLRADEIWHLYDGGPLVLHVLTSTGLVTHVLGRDVERGERPQWHVPHDTWFASETAPGVEFALAGCTVTPGFEFDDLELASRAGLCAEHPQHRALIERLTREER